MPLLLNARNLPQTLLLTALFLLIAVTTILLAFGPVAEPAPADEVSLPAAQDGGGGDAPTAEGEETTEESTAEPDGGFWDPLFCRGNPCGCLPSTISVNTP